MMNAPVSHSRPLPQPATGEHTLKSLAGRPMGLTAGKADPEAIAKSATQFEGMFMAQMLTHMWDGVEVDKTFGGGQGEEMFRGLLVTEYGKQISQRGGLGIAAAVQSELLKAQEIKS